MASTSTINELPPEILSEILRYLNLSELVEKKLVSKLWNELISSNLKISRLVADPYRSHHIPRWFHVNRPVDGYLETCDPNLFLAQLDRPILSRLKYLRIHCFDRKSSWIQPSDLNRFILLEHLEVELLRKYTSDFQLNLPNLRVLKVDFFQYSTNEQREIQVNIDAPKLVTLFWDRGVKLKSPETIRTLEADLYDSELSQFQNVEVYRCRTEFNFINDDLIQQLPKLKTLDILGDINNVRYSFGSLDEMKQFLKRLLTIRRRLGRPELRLFFAGIEIKSDELVDNLDLRIVDRESPFSSDISIESLYFSNNYPTNLQKQLEYVRSVDYPRLLSVTRNQIPTDYFKRFFNIQEVLAVGQIQDAAHFLAFLKGFEMLEILYLVNPALDQAWYDCLPTFCLLTNFYLDEKPEIELNFDFLGRFEPLMRGIRINRDLKLQSAKSLPNLFKFYKSRSGLRKFRFIFRGTNATIRMRKSKEDADQSDGSSRSYVNLDDDYDVLLGKELKLERVNSTEVLNFFEELENNENSD